MRGTVHLTLGGIAGRYKLDAIRPDGSVREVIDWFDNVITDNGLNLINVAPGNGTLSVNVPFPWCLVGTGTTPAATTDTQLVGFVAGQSAANSFNHTFVEESGSTPAYWTVTVTYTFATGAVVGNMAEVGVGGAITNANLFSRALIVDGTGSPTTITVLSDEQLRVTYELRSYIDKTDKTGIMTISGVDYNLTYRPAQISTAAKISNTLSVGGNTLGQVYSTNVLGTVYQLPAGTGISPTTLTPGTYTTNNYYRDYTYFWDINAANFAGGIGAIVPIWSQGKWQVKFSPKIPKDGTKKLTLNFRISWGRFTP